MDVTIIGAGIAGLAAAIGLARSGYQVTIVERLAEASQPSGFGIQITANGMCVLCALGVGRETMKAGIPASQASILDGRTGRALLTVALEKGDPTGGQYFLCRRSALVRNLETRAKQVGVAILHREDVLDIYESGSRVRCTLQGGSILESSLLIGADGLHSLCRRYLNPSNQGLVSSHVAWRACIAYSLSEGIVPGKVKVFVGPNRHLVAYSPDVDQGVNLVAVHRSKAGVAWQPPSLEAPDELFEQFGEFGGAVPTLLRGVGSVGRWYLCEAETPNRWYGDRTVLIGDALHPVLPFLAQGANLALEDAWILVRLLVRHGHAAAAFRAFRKARASRVARVSRASRIQGWVYHLRSPGLSRSLFGMMALGDRLLPGVARLPIGWIHGMDVVAGWPDFEAGQASSSTQMGT